MNFGKLTATLLCAVSLGLFNITAYAETPSKYRVAVSDLVLSDSLSAKAAERAKESSLIADIENAIRNGRKFELLTRRGSAMKAIRTEQEFAKSGLAAGDAAVEGQLANAESLVQVEVLRFDFGRSAQKIPNLDGKYRVSDYANVELSVQIIDTTRGVVTGSFPIKASTNTGTSIANGIGSASQSVLDKTLEKAAASLANSLSDTIFPITIIQVKGNRIWVNRGNDSGMQMGEKFIIFEPGEDLVDPQTGENLGSAEMEVGEAKVTRINPKVTVMEITKGDPTGVAQGFILRRPVK